MVSRTVALALLLATPLSAAARPDRYPLTLPPVALARAVAPHLARREVLVFESRRDGSASQATALTVLAAPLADVWALLTDVSAYTALSRNLVHATVRSRRPGRVEYAWELEVPLFNIEGVSSLETDPAARTVRGCTVRGDVMPACSLWRLTALGPRRTLGTLATYTNVGAASRFLAARIESSPITEHAMVADLAYTAVRSLKAALVERGRRPSGALARRTTLTPALGSGAPLPRPLIDRLLRRGEVAVLRYRGPGPSAPLEQATVLGRVAAPCPAAAGFVRDPFRWPDAIPDVDGVERLSADRYRVTFASFVVGFDADLTLSAAAPGWAMRATIAGGIGPGEVGWQVAPAGRGACVVAHATLSDATERHFVLRRLARSTPLMRQTLNMSRGFLNVRSLARAVGP